MRKGGGTNFWRCQISSGPNQFFLATLLGGPVRQVIGRDWSQKFPTTIWKQGLKKFCEQSLPTTCRTARYVHFRLTTWIVPFKLDHHTITSPGSLAAPLSSSHSSPSLGADVMNGSPLFSYRVTMVVMKLGWVKKLGWLRFAMFHPPVGQ